MCMQDWRIGSLIRPSFLGSSLTSDLIISSDRSRVAIMFSYLWDIGPLSDPGGIVIQIANLITLNVAPVNSPYMISMLTHGDLPTRAMTVNSFEGVGFVQAIAFTMPPEYLSAGLQQFKSEFSTLLPQAPYQP